MGIYIWETVSVRWLAREACFMLLCFGSDCTCRCDIMETMFV